MPVNKSIAAKRTEKVEEKAGAKKIIGKKKKVDSEDEAYVGAKGAKEKKEKDPDAPKKPQTAYFLFMNANRNEVKTANPELAFGPLTQKLTSMWKDLSDTERKKYEDLAAKDKERYGAECSAKGMTSSKKKAADSDAPKKGLSSFMLFSVEARERLKGDDIKQTELLKKIGAEWKALSDSEKKKWEAKAKTEKERYEREAAAYKGGDAAATAGSKRPAAKGVATASKKAKKETQSDEDENEEEDAEGNEDEEEDAAEDETKD